MGFNFISTTFNIFFVDSVRELAQGCSTKTTVLTPMDNNKPIFRFLKSQRQQWTVLSASSGTLEENMIWSRDCIPEDTQIFSDHLCPSNIGSSPMLRSLQQ
jgi:hypothetical protein